MTDAADRLNIVIASPIEPDQVERIRMFAPDLFAVHYDPDLLPKPQYVSDHGDEPLQMSADQHRRWMDLLAKADILFDFDRADPANLPVNAPRLRWVQATSSGVGEFLSETGLSRSRILVTTASGVHLRPLAEFAMLGLLYFFRGMPDLIMAKSDRRWRRHTNRGLEGARVVVIGLGAVGREIARQAALFGVEVIGLRRQSNGEPIEGVKRLIARHELRETLRTCDALVLSCPLTESTRLIIDAPEIDSFKPGMIIVNVARGALINEVEMIAALQDGRIAGAALDAFATEPLPENNPLWELPNVIISPHSASIVAAENSRIVDIFLDNLRRFADGQRLRNQYSSERGY